MLTPWQSARIMRGRRRRALSEAHAAASFFGAAMAGKLKKISDYLSDDEPRERQSPERMLAKMDRFFDRHEKRLERDGSSSR